MIYDRLGAYVWLYIGSALIGTIALVLTLTFRARHGTARGLSHALIDAPRRVRH